jgi:hypothetical protein
MAGGEELGSGQNSGHGVVGGEEQGEEEHEETSGYPPVVLEGLEVAGDGCPREAKPAARGE